jgi:hypothetical protein
MIRSGICAIAVVLIWVCAFGWASGLGWRTPLAARERIDLPAGDFHIVTGSGAAGERNLAVDGPGDDGSALQTARIGVNAGDFPILRYTFENFPRTLELSLVFRRAAAPDEVQAITVPWPGDGQRVVDMRRFPAWRGQIIELGFAQFATGQLVPASVAFQPFRLRSVQLSSLSWTGAMLALCTDWFGYTPWALASINALGSETTAPLPLLGTAVTGATLALVAAAIGLRWRKQRALHAAVMLGAATWVLLDVDWLHDLAAKHRLTESLYAQRTQAERERLAPNEDLTFIAGQTRDWLALQHVTSRVFVAADTSHNFFRMMYLLLPHNVAALFYLGDAPLPVDTLILLYGSKQWIYDAEHGAILGRGRVYPVVPVFGSGGAQLYRTVSAAQ